MPTNSRVFFLLFLTLLLAGVAFPAVSHAMKPFHSVSNHRIPGNLCQSCHSSHKAVGPQGLKERTAEAVCVRCHKASDIARWKTMSPFQQSPLMSPPRPQWSQIPKAALQFSPQGQPGN